MLKKTGSKKGFTLAELLIVVAIIAVLTAIAVPLFVGALGDAEKSVKEANIRAVRGAAIEKILLNDDPEQDYQHIGGGSTDDWNAGAWNVVAYVSTSGEIYDMEITAVLKSNNEKGPETATCEKEKSGEHEGDYKVTLTITELKATAKK